MNQSVRTALITGGVIVAILVILSVIPGLFGGWQGFGYGMMGPGMMGGFGTMFLMPVLWIVIPVLLIWAVVAAVRPGQPDSLARPSESALETLKKRYARGEINKQEYEEKKADLV